MLVDFVDSSVLLELHTDASKYALGGALLTHIDASFNPVAYIAKSSVQWNATIVQAKENCL